MGERNASQQRPSAFGQARRLSPSRACGSVAAFQPPCGEAMRIAQTLLALGLPLVLTACDVPLLPWF